MRSGLVFYGILGVLLVIVFTSGNIGAKQDAEMSLVHKQYDDAKENIENAKSSEAIAPLENLVKKYPNRYNIHQKLGLAYLQSGRINEASIHYEKALEIRPALIKDPIFDAQYGQIAYLLNHYGKAKELLQASLDNHIDSNLAAAINPILKKIEEMEAKGGTK